MQRPTTSLCVLNLTKFKDNISQSKKKKKKCSKKSDWIYTHLKKQYERCVHSESSTLETKERQEEKATCFYCVFFFSFHFISFRCCIEYKSTKSISHYMFCVGLGVYWPHTYIYSFITTSNAKFSHTHSHSLTHIG